MAAHGTLPGDAGQTDHRLINDLFAVNHLRHTKLLSGRVPASGRRGDGTPRHSEQRGIGKKAPLGREMSSHTSNTMIS